MGGFSFLYKKSEKKIRKKSEDFGVFLTSVRYGGTAARRAGRYCAAAAAQQREEEGEQNETMRLLSTSYNKYSTYTPDCPTMYKSYNV